MLIQATNEQLELAAAKNHTELFYLGAIARGGRVVQKNGLSWAHGGPGSEATIAFPSLPDEEAGLALDEMMNEFRKDPPKSAGCWSLANPRPADLGIRLLARGFQPGWKPCWMALDLYSMIRDHPCPQDLEIINQTNSLAALPKELPYSGGDGVISAALLDKYPAKAQHFIASLHGKIVAQSAIFFTEGDYGCAGIYNVAVLPGFRNLGIGKAVVIAACTYAIKRGYKYALLNATGRRMYEQIGFTWINDGFTWWLMQTEYITNPPALQKIAFIEALGRGDIDNLNTLKKDLAPGEWAKPLSNGMSLMELAVHTRQSSSATWLMEQGVTCTPLHAWDLGWKDRAAFMLRENPDLVNLRYGRWNASLMHIAVERNDPELAALALHAFPNLEARDSQYHGTALDWANYLKRKEIYQLIIDAGQKRHS